MRVLLLHPSDEPTGSDWSDARWDLIVDLGFAGRETYSEWARRLTTRVVGIRDFAANAEGYQWVNQLFEQGRGRLVDRQGLDWWEILAMESYQDVHTLYLLCRLREEVGEQSVELTSTRPHRSAAMAEQVFNSPVRYLARRKEDGFGRIARAFRSIRNLRATQVAEIAFDKWDSDYQVRRRWAKQNPAKSDEPLILLPSAYSNVTRSVLAYAAQLPARKFLLVTTRRNANPKRLPANATVDSLAAYVPSSKTTAEESEWLIERWRAFTHKMQSESEEFRWGSNAGLWNYFPAHLKQGLHLRDAWTCLLESRPVAGVLCGDDLNYHTRLPLILAQQKGLNSVYCSHGALDGGFLFKKSIADCYLVKGEMEEDYLRRIAPTTAERIVVGAPGHHGSSVQERCPEAIVFFSQPYEVVDGRADSIYRELIPRLEAVARANGKKLIVKLHPFESRRARQGLVDAALPASRRSLVEVVGHASPEEIMRRAWCGITVDSSVAVECALNGIPFFLCGWLDFTGMGYVEQFARFNAAKLLHTPEEIGRIPEMLGEYRPDIGDLRRLWQEADPHQLEEILFGRREARLSRCVC